MWNEPRPHIWPSSGPSHSCCPYNATATTASSRGANESQSYHAKGVPRTSSNAPSCRANYGQSSTILVYSHLKHGQYMQVAFFFFGNTSLNTYISSIIRRLGYICLIAKRGDKILAYKKVKQMCGVFSANIKAYNRIFA
jgi:hypothetical protein